MKLRSAVTEEVKQSVAVVQVVKLRLAAPDEAAEVVEVVLAAASSC